MSVAVATHLQSTAETELGAYQRFVLHGISWTFYTAFLAELGDHTRIRLTYDRGSLELMAPSYRHENYSRILGLLINVLAEELDVPLKGAGSTTFRREDLERGLEPDECFYVANVERIVGNTDIDLTRDPPPDLAIEIDITSSSLDRVGIYAALRVPEIWRFDGELLRINLLKSDGEYQESSNSPSFPNVPIQELTRYLDLFPGTDETRLTKSFRKWVRENLKSSESGGMDRGTTK